MTQLPTDWRLATLGEVASPVPRSITDGPFGSNLTSAHYTVAGPRVIRLQNIGDGRFIDNPAHISQSHFNDLRAHEALSGDLIVASLGQDLPRACLVPTWLGQAIVKADCIRVRLGEDVEPRWALYAMQTPNARRWAAEQLHGVGRPRLGLKVIRAIPIPLPPIEDQRRILNILEGHLSRLDAAAASLMSTRRRLVAYQRAALDCLTEDAAMRHIALGDALATVEAGRSFGGAARPSFDDEWGIVKVSAMTWGEFRPEENKLVSDQSRVDPRYQIHAGDLLMSRANTSEYVGAPVLVRAEPARLLLSDKSLRLVSRDGVSAEYLWRVLSAPRARAQISDRASGNQDSMRNISQATLKTIVIPWTDDQHGVISAANDLDDQRARMSAVIDRSRTRGTALRRALLHAAFSGWLTGRSLDLERVEEAVG